MSDTPEIEIANWNKMQITSYIATLGDAKKFNRELTMFERNAIR